jgi:hypothetical protein
MNLKDNTVVAVLVVIVLTLIAEVPAINHNLTELMLQHGNLVVLIEGIIGAILVWWSGRSKTVTVR